MSTKAATATIIGSPVSPYVRKVLAVCEMKGVPYRLDPIVPFFGDDEFSVLSPLRRIPVFIDDKVSLCDSTVICEYLDERFPAPSLLPGDPAQRARARWLEEFSDTRMGDVFIWRVFYEAVILPFIFQKPREKEKIAERGRATGARGDGLSRDGRASRRFSGGQRFDRRHRRGHTLQQSEVGAGRARQAAVAKDFRLGRAHAGRTRLWQR